MMGLDFALGPFTLILNIVSLIIKFVTLLPPGFGIILGVVVACFIVRLIPL